MPAVPQRCRRHGMRCNSTDSVVMRRKTRRGFPRRCYLRKSSIGACHSSRTRRTSASGPFGHRRTQRSRACTPARETTKKYEEKSASHVCVGGASMSTSRRARSAFQDSTIQDPLFSKSSRCGGNLEIWRSWIFFEFLWMKKT